MSTHYGAKISGGSSAPRLYTSKVSQSTLTILANICFVVNTFFKKMLRYRNIYDIMSPR